METPRSLKSALICLLLLGIPTLGRAQSIRAAAVGFSYAAAPTPDATSPPLATACEPNRAMGAAIGAVVGAAGGAFVGFVYALSTLLVGPKIPIQAFVVAGAVGGGIHGAIAEGNCLPR